MESFEMFDDYSDCGSEPLENIAKFADHMGRCTIQGKKWYKFHFEYEGLEIYKKQNQDRAWKMAVDRNGVIVVEHSWHLSSNAGSVFEDAVKAHLAKKSAVSAV